MAGKAKAKRRGASASRSSFRGAAATIAKSPKKSTKKSTKSSTKKSTKKSTKSSTKKSTKSSTKKPTKSSTKKPTKSSTKSSAKKSSVATPSAPTKPAAAPPADRFVDWRIAWPSLLEPSGTDTELANPSHLVPSQLELIGKVTAPSGQLCIFDVGLMPYLPRHALEPMMIIVDAPTDRALSVVGRRVGKGRFASCWDHVAITLGDGDITHARKLGSAAVDFARLICIDKGALDHWQHEDSLDGQADFVFWGRDAGKLAQAMRAPASTEGHGWTNLPLADAESRADRAAQLKAENRWLLAMDLRPHSHHHQVLAAARANKTGAGTIEVGGASACLFFTSWGDGVFPVFLDLDHDDKPVRIRVQLATEDSNAAMHAVNA